MSKTTVPPKELALDELKRLAKELKAEPSTTSHQQRLDLAAKKVGFSDFRQARRVLTGQAVSGEDFGTFWHTRPAGGFLNEWHADYQQARDSWAQQPTKYLLPYRTQFVIVGADFMQHLGIETSQLSDARDLVAEVGGESWDALCYQRLRALRARSQRSTMFSI